MLGLIMKFFSNMDLPLLPQNLLLVVLWTIFILQFKNKSNISPYIIVPIITALTAKYFIGDFDQGFSFTPADIFYWVLLFVSSIVTIFLFEKMKKQSKKK